jgi:hypothetical protein
VKGAGVAAVILLAVSAGSALAGRVIFVVRPSAVAAGGVVTVSATSSPCLNSREHVAQQVTLISAAFPGHAFGREGAVNVRIGKRGSFSVRTHIRSGLRPGRYEVTARCGGGHLNAAAYIRVR